MPTLQTVADAAGVSRMTVSRALRNDRSIPPATTERIRRIAEQLEYRPDPLVSALMAKLRGIRSEGHPPVLAYVTAYKANSIWTRFRYMQQMQQGALERAAALGFRLEEFNLTVLKVTPARLGLILHSRGIRGLIIAPLPEMARFEMDFSPFAAAAIGTSLIEPDLHRAQSRHRRNLGLAWDHLRMLGCRRIGLVLSQQQDERTEYVLSSLMLHYHRLERSSELVPTLAVRSLNENVVCKWLKRWQPDAVLSFQHDLGTWITRRKLKIPVLVNLNWQPGDGADFGIDQQHAQQGAAAVDLVVEQLFANSYGVPPLPKTVMLAGRWIDAAQSKS